MPLALVTGLRPHLGSVAATLARTGFNVVTWETTAASPLPSGPFDCYVQLPGADGLVRRVDTLAAVAPRLSSNASILLGVEDTDPSARRQPGALAPDLLAAVALALLEDLGLPAARVAVLSVEDLCRPAPGFTRIDPVVGTTQWEMPTPPLVSAP